MKRILIVGATSAIAEATARRYAREGAAFYLLARDGERLAALAADLKIAGAGEAHCAAFDANDFDRHKALIDMAYAALGGLDLVLIAHGTLSNQAACEKDFALTLQEINTNALSAISLLTCLANRFEAQGNGTIAVISSVAGDRGRQSNYIYGTAKGALTIFLQGLRNRLASKGVQVLTIKPGFVDTPMTTSFRKGALWAKPEQIAEGIYKAVARRRDVVYLPFFWRWIMLIIRSIPEGIFKKLKL
jgi:decaprenylphospho-beta-D-erythro-pentofuranosid-2-ulose 2-reductase